MRVSGSMVVVAAALVLYAVVSANDSDESDQGAPLPAGVEHTRWKLKSVPVPNLNDRPLPTPPGTPTSSIRRQRSFANDVLGDCSLPTPSGTPPRRRQTGRDSPVSPPATPTTNRKQWGFASVSRWKLGSSKTASRLVTATDRPDVDDAASAKKDTMFMPSSRSATNDHQKAQTESRSSLWWVSRGPAGSSTYGTASTSPGVAPEGESDDLLQEPGMLPDDAEPATIFRAAYNVDQAPNQRHAVNNVHLPGDSVESSSLATPRKRRSTLMGNLGSYWGLPPSGTAGNMPSRSPPSDLAAVSEHLPSAHQDAPAPVYPLPFPRPSTPTSQPNRLTPPPHRPWSLLPSDVVVKTDSGWKLASASRAHSRVPDFAKLDAISEGAQLDTERSPRESRTTSTVHSNLPNAPVTDASLRANRRGWRAAVSLRRPPSTDGVDDSTRLPKDARDVAFGAVDSSPSGTRRRKRRSTLADGMVSRWLSPMLKRDGNNAPDAVDTITPSSLVVHEDEPLLQYPLSSSNPSTTVETSSSGSSSSSSFWTRYALPSKRAGSSTPGLGSRTSSAKSDRRPKRTARYFNDPDSADTDGEMEATFSELITLTVRPTLPKAPSRKSSLRSISDAGSSASPRTEVQQRPYPTPIPSLINRPDPVHRAPGSADKPQGTLKRLPLLLKRIALKRSIGDLHTGDRSSPPLLQPQPESGPASSFKTLLRRRTKSSPGLTIRKVDTESSTRTEFWGRSPTTPAARVDDDGSRPSTPAFDVAMTPTSTRKAKKAVQIGSPGDSQWVRRPSTSSTSASVLSGASTTSRARRWPTKLWKSSSSNNAGQMPTWAFTVSCPYPNAFSNLVIPAAVRVLINTIRHGEPALLADHVQGLFGAFDDAQLAQQCKDETDRVALQVVQEDVARPQATLTNPLDGATKRAAGFLLLTWLNDAARQGHAVLPSLVVDSLAAGGATSLDSHMLLLGKGRAGVFKEVIDLIVQVIYWQRHLPAAERLTLRQLSKMFASAFVGPDHDDHLQVDGKVVDAFHQYARDALLAFLQRIVAGGAISLEQMADLLTHAAREYRPSSRSHNI